MRWNWLAVLMCLGVLVGCARNKHDSGDLDGGNAAVLQIVNHHWQDVDIYVIRDGQRTRVGMVTASTEQTFALSPSLTRGVGTLQLEAHSIGAPGGIRSEAMAARPGMQIEWTLENNLSRSSLAIY